MTTERVLVVCPGCGDSVFEHQAWTHPRDTSLTDHDVESFDLFCWDCYQDIHHQDRRGLESFLEEIEEPGLDSEAFVEHYCQKLDEQEAL